MSVSNTGIVLGPIVLICQTVSLCQLAIQALSWGLYSAHLSDCFSVCGSNTGIVLGPIVLMSDCVSLSVSNTGIVLGPIVLICLTVSLCQSAIQALSWALYSAHLSDCFSVSVSNTGIVLAGRYSVHLSDCFSVSVSNTRIVLGTIVLMSDCVSLCQSAIQALSWGL